MNARLRAFLDDFGFAYDFRVRDRGATARGEFDAALLRVLERHDADPRRRAADAGPGAARHLQPVPADLAQDRPRAAGADRGMPRRPRAPSCSATRTAALTEVPVTGGHCKMQWKADWAMRWVALDVDYEMSGKDLIDSVTLGSQDLPACWAASRRDGFTYELFLDETGQKISKSKGNGLTIDEWLRYAAPESLTLFLYRDPQGGQAPVLRRHPAADGRVSAAARRLRRSRRPSSSWPTRSGTSTTGRRPRTPAADLLRHAAQPRQCRERRGARRCSGASSAATRPAPRRRRAPCSPAWSSTPSPTTGTSSARRNATALPTDEGARRA